MTEQCPKPRPTLLYGGIVSSVVAVLCCAAPTLVMRFAVVALSWLADSRLRASAGIGTVSWPHRLCHLT